MIGKIIDLPQGSPAWLNWRLDGVGASDLASILGISPYKNASREAVFREKVARVQREGTYAMRRGNLLEPEARAAYQRRHPCNVKVCCVEHPLYSWARSSLDGLCWTGGAMPANPWILELKNLKESVHRQTLDGKVPEFNVPQLQWQMFCSGLRIAHYASYSKHSAFDGDDRLAVVPVRRDEDAIGELVNEAAAFWMDVLDARELTGVVA